MKLKWTAVLCSIAVLLLIVNSAALKSNANFVDTPETRIPGKQVMVANYTKHAPTIDGVFRPFEWAGAVPVYVDGSTPATAPGVVPNLPSIPTLLPPDSPEDSSFTIYTLYDDNYLYVAVDVTDDIVFTDSDLPWLDDDVEIMIDGDRQPGDYNLANLCGPSNPNCPIPVANLEGYKLTTSARGAQQVDPPNHPNIVWESKAGLTRKGFVVEYKISLDSISTTDTSWWPGSTATGISRPQPGDIIGFNVAVGDDDNGGDSYLRTFDGQVGARSDSYTAWDGRSVGWNVGSEQDWGNLYFAPHSH
jgi:hypothetical protein